MHIADETKKAQTDDDEGKTFALGSFSHTLVNIDACMLIDQLTLTSRLQITQQMTLLKVGKDL